MTSEPALLYDVQGHVATITLNRPARMNAFSTGMIDLWQEAILRAHDDDGVRAVIVTGAGRGFCAGADVAEDGGGGAASIGAVSKEPAANRNRLRNSVQRIPRALQSLEKPYIAAVNGGLWGRGWTWRPWRTCASPRIERASAPPTRAWASSRATAAPTSCRASWGWRGRWSCSGRARIFDAEEALAMGYVTRVVPHDELMQETMAFAEAIANGPAVAVQLLKRLAYRSQEVGLHEALEMAEQAMVIVRTTEDSREGPRAFREKRAPRFVGR